jgi:hypothetical protein
MELQTQWKLFNGSVDSKTLNTALRNSAALLLPIGWIGCIVDANAGDDYSLFPPHQSLIRLGIFISINQCQERGHEHERQLE